MVDYRGEHWLSRVFPLLYDILGRIAEDCECVMALGDEFGQLLWVCGQPDVLRKAETINFAEGTSWAADDDAFHNKAQEGFTLFALNQG